MKKRCIREDIQALQERVARLESAVARQDPRRVQMTLPYPFRSAVLHGYVNDAEGEERRIR